jgi:probable phosphoglycerate mutase
MEMCFGEYEGMENTFSVPDCPINVLFKNPENYITPVKGAESLEELYSRTGSFLKEKVEPDLKQNKDILIVGHGAMNCSIVCQIKGLPVKEFWSAGIDNCKLMRLI